MGKTSFMMLPPGCHQSMAETSHRLQRQETEAAPGSGSVPAD